LGCDRACSRRSGKLAVDVACVVGGHSEAAYIQGGEGSWGDLPQAGFGIGQPASPTSLAHLSAQVLISHTSTHQLITCFAYCRWCVETEQARSLSGPSLLNGKTGDPTPIESLPERTLHECACAWEGLAVVWASPRLECMLPSAGESCSPHLGTCGSLVAALAYSVHRIPSSTFLCPPFRPQLQTGSHCNTNTVTTPLGQTEMLPADGACIADAGMWDVPTPTLISFCMTGGDHRGQCDSHVVGPRMVLIQ
jgi:hypothetical protein